MLMPDAIAAPLTFPATSVQVPEADCPLPSEPSPTGAEQDAMPDRPSDPLNVTVTPVLFHPAAFAAGATLAVAVGAVLSTRTV